MNIMNKLTLLEWKILNNLANDRECPATILPEVAEEVGNVSREEIIDALLKLFDKGLIDLPDGNGVTKKELLAEPEDNFGTRLWFGLTRSGCSAWEAHAKEYYGEFIDWSSAWTGFISYLDKKGYVDGISFDVCKKALDKILAHEKKWEIDRNSLEDMPIDGFYAKYFKHINGGHRIMFKIKKSKC
jgi:hypothetical protein